MSATDYQPRRPTVDELAHAKGMQPIRSLEDLQRYAIRLFDSDVERDEFLALVREVRDSDIS